MSWKRVGLQVFGRRSVNAWVSCSAAIRFRLMSTQYLHYLRPAFTRRRAQAFKPIARVAVVTVSGATSKKPPKVSVYWVTYYHPRCHTIGHVLLVFITTAGISTYLSSHVSYSCLSLFNGRVTSSKARVSNSWRMWLIDQRTLQFCRRNLNNVERCAVNRCLSVVTGVVSESSFQGATDEAVERAGRNQTGLLSTLWWRGVAETAWTDALWWHGLTAVWGRLHPRPA